ncbi:phospholipase A1-II 2-like, partial [Phragmites australis]|uniref:phospholipase A1-II 2-like n=1 Tax=Phragmites australis TaxID=29695 RepID=UPI002D776D6D
TGWQKGGIGPELSEFRSIAEVGVAMFSGDMAERWRELHCSERWEGLLDPLDVDLLRCLIAYGEMITATYEAFIGESRSPNAGMCRYRRAVLFRRVDVSHPGWYAATRYIYATASADVHGKVLLRPLCREGRARECNWMGYVSVATDEGAAALGRRDIVVAWRGTQHALEWVADLKLALASAAGILGPEGADGSDPSVHRGYLSLYTSADEGSKLSKQSARMQVLTEIAGLLDKYKDEETSITVVGHSLGATLATLNAVDIVANAYNKSPGSDDSRGAPVTAVVFGSPRMGDRDFGDIFHRLPGLQTLRVRNRPDRVPPYLPVGYADVGVELLIDTRRSPFLKPHGKESQSRDLEDHLHGVAGWQGERCGFELVLDRDAYHRYLVIDGYMIILEQENA